MCFLLSESQNIHKPRRAGRVAHCSGMPGPDEDEGGVRGAVLGQPEFAGDARVPRSSWLGRLGGRSGHETVLTTFLSLSLSHET